MITYIIVGVVLWPALFGMVYHDLCATDRRPENRRENAGMAVIFATMGSLFWPVAFFFVFCMTGFAQHGIVRFKE